MDTAHGGSKLSQGPVDSHQSDFPDVKEQALQEKFYSQISISKYASTEEIILHGM